MINDTQRDDSSLAIRFSAKLDEPFGSQLRNADTCKQYNDLAKELFNRKLQQRTLYTYIYIYITNPTDLKTKKKEKSNYNIITSQCNGISRFRISKFNFFFQFKLIPRVNLPETGNNRRVPA